MKQLASFGLVLAWFVPVGLWGVVARHDVAAERFLLGEVPGYLADLPHEGHGVLVHPEWVVTVAHTIFYDYEGKVLHLAGRDRRIAEVVVHPDFEEPSPEMLTGDSAALMEFLQGRSDIALIRLAEPAADATPIQRFSGKSEIGHEVMIFGRGATGNGIQGEVPTTKRERTLRRCSNRVILADEQWLSYSFDEPGAGALPLEGMHGSGDSGGAAVAVIEGRPVLVGLSSWQYWEGDLTDYQGGLYGTRAFQVRIGWFVDWIDQTIAGQRAVDE